MIAKVVGEKGRIRMRCEGYGTRQFVSDTFLQKMSDIFEKHHEDIIRMPIVANNIIEALRTLLSTYQTDLDNIRFELARVPIEFKGVNLVYRHTYYGTPQYQLGIQHGIYKYLPDDNDRPDYVPSLKEKKVGDRVWCLCSKQQANQLGVFNIPTWREDDSLIDWITESVKPAEREKAQTQTTQLPGTEQLTPTPPTVQTELTPTEQIYHYIRDNQPVTTAEIRQQNFVGKSRTFAILKDLQRDDKIVKNAHGVYNTVNAV